MKNEYPRGFTTEELEQSPASRDRQYDAFKGLEQCVGCHRWYDEDDVALTDDEHGEEVTMCWDCITTFVYPETGQKQRVFACGDRLPDGTTYRCPACFEAGGPRDYLN